MPILPQTQVILERFAKNAVDKMKSNASKYRASGEMEKGFRYLINNRGATIFGVEYVTWFEQGRGKTKNSTAGNPTLRDKLVEWLAFKGIPLWRDSKGRFVSRKTMAYVIARKIHREGVSWYKKQPRNIYSNVLTPESIDKLKNQLAETESISISSDIRKVLKTIRGK